MKDATKPQRSKSGHIEFDRLHDVVERKTVLGEREVKHLSGCERCLAAIRFFVGQGLSTTASQRRGDSSLPQ